MMREVVRTREVSHADGKEITRETEQSKVDWLAMAPALAAVGGVLVAVVTAWLGIETYARDRDARAYAANKDLQSRTLEAKKPFYEKQIAFYVDAMNVASKLATSPAPNNDDIELFWQLYWGRLAAVEDTKVDEAMVLFGDLLNAKAGISCLRSASLLLAHCVRQSWADTWGVKLGDPPESPCTPESFSGLKSCK